MLNQSIKEEFYQIESQEATERDHQLVEMKIKKPSGFTTKLVSLENTINYDAGG